MGYAHSKGQTDDCYDNKSPVRAPAAEFIHAKWKKKQVTLGSFSAKRNRSEPSM